MEGQEMEPWIVGSRPSERFPLWTRANVGEVFPDPVDLENGNRPASCRDSSRAFEEDGGPKAVARLKILCCRIVRWH